MIRLNFYHYDPNQYPKWQDWVPFITVDTVKWSKAYHTHVSLYIGCKHRWEWVIIREYDK